MKIKNDICERRKHQTSRAHTSVVIEKHANSVWFYRISSFCEFTPIFSLKIPFSRRSFSTMVEQFVIETVHSNSVAVIIIICPKDVMNLDFFLTFFFLLFLYVYAIKLRYDNCVLIFVSGLVIWTHLYIQYLMFVLFSDVKCFG